MRPRGTPNLDLTLALDKNIRREREACRELIQVSSDEIRVWFRSKIESCKQIIADNHDAASLRQSDSISNGRSPPNKKMKVDSSKIPHYLTTDMVCAMKVKELQNELKKLGLSANGRKHDLKERLLEVLNEDCHVMPFRDEISREPNDTDMEEVHDETGDPVNLKSINQVAHDQSLALPKDTNVARGGTRQKTEEEVIPLSSDEVDIMPSISLVSSSSIKSELEKEAKVENVDEDCTSASASKPSNSETRAVLSPLENAKQSRSPLKVVQSGVQSAIKKLTAKSPLASTWSAQKKRAVAEVQDLSQKAMVSRAATKENSNFKYGLSSKSEESHDDDHQQPSDVIPPPVCHELPLQPKGSAIRSIAVQAKTEARKAKLAEMRGKSKTLTEFQQASNPKEPFRPLGGLSHSVMQFSTSYEGKRMNLAAQMRAKAAAQLSQGKAIAPAPVGTKTAPDARLGNETTNHPTDSTGKRIPLDMERQVLPYSTKLKTGSTCTKDAPGIEILSPMDTYELSDKDESDSDSDSDDGDSKEEKYVPRWAQQPVLVSLLEHQYRKSLRDPDEIFGEVQTCDLNAIFEGKKARYQKRTSSGNWSKDKLTAAETLAYKRTMQYTKEFK